MPIMDGFELARRIEKMARFEQIPLVFITAICTEDPSVRQGYKVGAIVSANLSIRMCCGET